MGLLESASCSCLFAWVLHGVTGWRSEHVSFESVAHRHKMKCDTKEFDMFVGNYQTFSNIMANKSEFVRKQKKRKEKSSLGADQSESQNIVYHKDCKQKLRGASWGNAFHHNNSDMQHVLIADLEDPLKALKIVLNHTEHFALTLVNILHRLGNIQDIVLFSSASMLLRLCTFFVWSGSCCICKGPLILKLPIFSLSQWKFR